MTHRGNRREDIFFSDGDRANYLDLLSEYSKANGLDIWAYCLMTNHVHLLVVPGRSDSLARGIGLTHRRHAQSINIFKKWTGHLWEHRYYSTALDEAHLWSAVRYIEQNPVRAGLVARAEDYHWSSAQAHCCSDKNTTGSNVSNDLKIEKNLLLSSGSPFPAPDVVGNWSDWLSQSLPDEVIERLRRCTRTGRPCGDLSFVTRLESILKRVLSPQKRGPKAKEE